MEGKEKIMSIEKRLHDASLNGNVHILNQIMQEDGLTLARVSTACLNETPLHIAAMLGHLDFAKAVVGYVPQLVAEQDCQGFSPLHLASANGHTEIVKLLLQVNADVCLVRDEDGRTPLHLATMKGRVDVAEELIRVKPEAAECTLNTTGETLLHLAVKYNRFRSLKLLVELAGENQDVLNTKDNNGNTVLHLAACLKQTETVKYLLGAKVEVDAVNANGFTALDIVENMPRDLKVMEIRESLLMFLSETTVSRMNHVAEERSNSDVIAPLPSNAFQDTDRNVNIPKSEEDWVNRKFQSLTVAATVVASMAYQAGINPPGGIWSTDDTQQFKAGTSILATKMTAYSHAFWISNTISFISSLSVLFLLVSGLRLKSKFLVWMLMVSMWITITSIALSYLFSMSALQPDREWTALLVADFALIAWLCLLFIVIIVHIVRLFIRVYRKLRKSRFSRRENTSTRQVHENV